MKTLEQLEKIVDEEKRKSLALRMELDTLKLTVTETNVTLLNGSTQTVYVSATSGGAVTQALTVTKGIVK